MSSFHHHISMFSWLKRDEQHNKICQHENIKFFFNITFGPHLKPDLLRNRITNF